MKNIQFIVSILLLTLTVFSFRISAAEPVQLSDGWSFNYVAVGTDIMLTEVATSGGERLIIPATVTIDGTDYTIISLKNGLFKDNIVLKSITIPSSVISLGTEIATEEPSAKPFSGNPITLDTPVASTDTWYLNAVVNTGGEAFNAWGTALLATGADPVGNFAGGFQFFVNNSTSNKDGKLVYAYDSKRHTFSDAILILPSATNDISINLSYARTGKYTVVIGSADNSEQVEITPTNAFKGFSQLSSAISAAGTFSKLAINRCIFNETAGSLLEASSLTYISVNAGNPAYTSYNGSLYDKTGENVLVDLSEFNGDVQKPLALGDGWSFTYVTLGSEIILTEVVASGSERLIIPATVAIDGVDYTITALEKDLFKDNASLKRLIISSALTSLSAEISTEVPDTKPYAGNPITLASPVESTDIWFLNAVVNTGGESFNQWGTALLATGTDPTANSFPGGFQFFANNATSNNNGKIVFKQNNLTRTFSEAILLPPGGTNDLAINLSCDRTGKYTIVLGSAGNTERIEVTPNPVFAGFTELSSAISAAGTFSKLQINKCAFGETAGSLAEAPALTYISVATGNTVYSSLNGSLYDKAGTNTLVDLSIHNGVKEQVPVAVNNGWTFHYITIGSEIILTDIAVSGGELLTIPATVNIDGADYTITALKNNLFDGNTALKRLIISSALTSLGTEITTEALATKPYVDNPVTLTMPVAATDIWFINALVNTGGEAAGQWGTALIASGEVPNESDYSGGFQFWLNNGTSNKDGKVVYKYGSGNTKYQFPDEMLILPGHADDLSINLTYDKTGKYTAILNATGNTQKFAITPESAFEGFDKLSSNITAAGAFSQLEISKCAFNTTVGSLSGASALRYIIVEGDNTVYSSANGSLYDAAGTSVLVDLSEYNDSEKEPVEIDNWSFNYTVIGADIILTEVVESGDAILTIPATVEIDGITYTIKWLSDELFTGNTTLTEITIPATITSLDTEVAVENPVTTQFPVELATPVVAGDIWRVDARVNTGGEAAGQWGTALLATGDNPTGDDYTGGFQFWLNNGTAAGENSKGTIVYKYGAGSTKYIFPDAVTVKKGSKEDIAISLAYNDTEYTSQVTSGGATENFTISTAACEGFSILSGNVPAAGSFSELTVTILDPAEGAGSLLGLENLEKITVDAENTVYSSIDGSLYDKSGETLLVDLSDDVSVPGTQSGSVQVYGFQGKIVIKGLTENDTCRAYTLSGIEIDYKSTNLPAGIYVVTINGISYKVII